MTEERTVLPSDYSDTVLKRYPSTPSVDGAPDELFDGGHLWIQEKVDGAHLRFQLLETGVVRFGGRDRTFDQSAIPGPYRHAVRHVRERLDRDALRNAVDSVEDVVFFGEATQKRSVEYDWDRTPSVLCFDIWSESKNQFLSPDATEQIVERLGLTPVNAFQKELRAVDFDAERYEIPNSKWYDGPAAGVIVRNKTGLRAELSSPAVGGGTESTTDADSAADLANAVATPDRFEKIARRLEVRGTPVTFDDLYDRVLEDIAREKHQQLFDEDAEIDGQAFRSAVAARTREFLDEGR